MQKSTVVVYIKMKFALSFLAGLVASGSVLAQVPYQEYVLAPKSRTLYPKAVHSSNGSVSSPESLISPTGSSTLQGKTATAYDFGINIAGIVTLNVGKVSSNNEYIGVTFSESSMWISDQASDATTNGNHGDEILWFHITGSGTYTAPREKERGGFRYVTLSHNGTGSVELTGIQVHYTAMPHWADDAIGNYAGYFHSNGMSLIPFLQV